MSSSGRVGLALALTLAGWGGIAEAVFRLMPPFWGVLSVLYLGGFWAVGVVGFLFKGPQQRFESDQR